jgi:DNA repair protein RecO (recombination protein O)
MKISEKGFVLQRVAYSETSMVLKCFTLTHGLKSFLLQGAKKKFAHLIQPMSPIAFSFNLKNHEQLAKMYEPHLVIQATDIPFNNLKTSLVFFQNEVLSNVLIDGQIDEELFYFLLNEYQFLDEQTYHPNYIIFWLFKLIKILGFDPLALETSLENSTIHLNKLTYRTREDWLNLTLSKIERKQIVSGLLAYYQSAIPNFKPIKTLEVYQSIWYQ